jgi:hypothetical protein
MSEGQDFLSLGLDISGFDESKKAQLQQYIQLFEQLSKYDGKVINPILGPGLAELNTSISATNKLLSEINVQLSQFTSSTNTATTAVRQAASSSKLLTDEQAKQKVQIAELNRLKIEQAKADNILVQSRRNAAAAIKEQFDMETQLSAQRKKDSALIQALMQKEAKAEEELSKQQERDLKVLSAMRKKDAAERQALIKKQAQEEEDEALQNEKDRKTIIKLQQQQQAESRRTVAQSQREQAANKVLTNDYYLLTQALKDQAVAYSNLYINKGANDPATKQALADYGATAAVIGNIDKKLESAQPKAFGLGKGLSSIYNQLRIIAYVLPGIGIAGIVNVAYELVSKIVEQLFEANNELKDTFDNEKRINDAVRERLGIYQNMFSVITEIADIEYKNNERNLELAKKRGTPVDVTFPIDLKNANVRLDDSRKNMLSAFNGESNIKSVLERRQAELSDASKELDRISKLENELVEANKTFYSTYKEGDGDKLDFIRKRGLAEEFILSSPKKEEIQAAKDAAKSRYDTANSLYKELKGISDTYYDDLFKKESLEAEEFKRRADEKRQIELESTKDRLSVQLELNKKVLDSELSGLDIRLDKLNKIASIEKGVNNADLKNILDDTTTTKAAREEAILHTRRENEKIDIQLRIDSEKEIEDARQRRLEAQKNIDKQELESSAVTNERLFQNDKNGLDERLDAYVKYVSAKQKIQDIEYRRDIDVLRLKAKDKNGNIDPTVQKEIEALQVNRDSQKIEAQAQVEKQVYDIVSSSYDRQLKLVKEANESQNSESKKEYTKQLNDLNDAYDKRLISYKRYKKQLDKINKDYTTKGFDDDIKDDLEDIERLTKLIESEKQRLKSANDKVDTAKIGVEVANTFGGDKNQAKKALDSATGEQEAITDEITKATNERNAKQEKLADDELKRAKSRNSKKEKQDIDWYIISEKVERQLYEAVKGFADKQYEYRAQMVEKNKALIDEQYEYEIQAIQKSTLSAKDKAALEIQLHAQKREYDKKAAADEKKIKIEQAQFDKKLAIMHIILSTAMAVMAYNAKANPAGAIAAGIAGGIELGVAISTPIPSFKEGVKNFKGGPARYGEAGMEVVKEPGKQARLVMTETISYLPKGTDIIPVKESPVFEEKIADNGWEQTLYLAKEIRKSKTERKSSTTIIKIDLGFENYKKRILGNG